MRYSTLILFCLIVAVIGVSGLAWQGRQELNLHEQLLPIQQIAKGELLPSKEKRQYFEKFVDRNGNSQDEDVQDAVTSARMRLAYLDAYENKPEDAREQFLEAEEKHAGSDAMDPDYGTMPDQARYQAINCLMLEGKEAEAKTEYISFLKERPLSPLVFGVHKRLLKLLDENEPRDVVDQHLQVAVDKQAAFNRRELALCGPRCIEKLIEVNSLSKVPLDDIVKASGMTDDGTSMMGMQKGLELAGLQSEGMLVNSADFNKTQLPFIWLDNQHYLLVHTRKNDKFVVYDPFIRNDREVAAPKHGADFSATILKLK